MIYVNHKWYKGRLTFNLDGLIVDSTSHKQYKHMLPNEISVDNINRAYSEGWYIVVVTDRYKSYTNGNIDLPTQMGHNETKQWLRKFGVNFNELVFGDSLKDVYVSNNVCSIETMDDWNNNFWPLLKKLEEKDAKSM